MNSIDNIKTQVVIVGAGPTGLSMAAQMIRYNIDFIIIDRNERPTQLSKALVIQARTLEIFQELGIVDKAIQLGQITSKLQLFYKGKKKIVVNIRDIGKGLSDFPMALSLEQSKTEEILYDFLKEHGKNVLWRYELSQIEQTEDGVIVTIKNQHTTYQKIHCSYLIGCDGAGSSVRHALNLSFEGSTEPKLFYVADVKLSSSVINTNSLYMFMIKKGFVLFFPMYGPGHYRIVGVLPEYKNGDEYKFSDIEDSIKQEIVSPVEFDELRWFSTYKVHSRKANSFMNGHCFIAGDAAHIHTPAGGQGMNTGIQDAYNLGWKLAYVIKRQLNSDILFSYNQERTENAKRLLNTTDRMFDIFSGVNRIWNFLRLTFLPSFMKVVERSNLIKRRIFPLISQTGISYRNSPLTLKSSIGKVNAGDRMHYFLFSDGKSIFSYLKEPCFKVLYFGKNEVDKSLFKTISFELRIYSFREIPASLFGHERDFLILLRPDNHISYIGKDIEKCKSFLLKISIT